MRRLAPCFAIAKSTRAMVLSLSCFLLFGCSSEGNFASFPGFAEHFEAKPPRTTVPTAEEQALLERFRPRVYLAENQPSFVDFYSDYIAHGRLKLNNTVVSEQVSQALLNQYKNNAAAEFVHDTGHHNDTTPTVFARVDYDSLQLDDQSWDLSFLSYNLVFPSSGLLAEIPWFARSALGVVADLDDWHQLDHYVGVTVVLYQQEPIAYYLQQHNYQSTYVLAEQQNWPADNRVQVDVAFRSNELYRHSADRQRHPGLSFVEVDSMEFYKTGRNKPMMAGWDITHGELEQEYELAFLAPDDAFYQFKGRLGEARRLPGRDGPPGADYVTLPGLMKWSHRLVAGYRPQSVERERQKLNALFDKQNFLIKAPGIRAYVHDFVQAWQGPH